MPHDDPRAADAGSHAAGDSSTDPAITDASTDPPLAIGRALLVRLLHEHFDDGRVRLAAPAAALLQRYMDTFVREGLARAMAERQADGAADGFVQLDQLEKTGPQLLLDFG